MLNIFGKLFDSNERELDKILPIVEKINSLEKETKKLKDKDFPKKTQEFKERLEEGEPLENILPEAFALVREASFRTIGQRHYDVQLVAGISLLFSIFGIDIIWKPSEPLSGVSFAVKL